MNGIDWNAAALLQILGQLQRQQTNATSAGAVNNYNPNPPSNNQWNAPIQHQQQRQSSMQQLLTFMLQQQAMTVSPPSAAPVPPAPPWGPNPLASVLVHPEGCAMLWQLFQVWIQAQHSQQQQQQGSSYTPPGVPMRQAASRNPFVSSSSRTVDWNALFPMFFQACLTSLQTPQTPQTHMALPPMGQTFSPPAAAAFGPATLSNNGFATLQETGNPPFAMLGEHQDDSEDHENDNDDDSDRKMPAVERGGGRKKRRYNHESFPQKLHRLITDAAADGQEDAVRFSNKGTRFQIVDTKKFEELLPRYFRHGKISSFKRVLHMYDFKHVTGTWNEGTFEHPHFRRDEPEMLKKVLRVNKGYGDKY